MCDHLRLPDPAHQTVRSARIGREQSNLFITIPMIELIFSLTVGDWIGLPATIGVVILTGFLGAWLTKKEGLRTLQR